MGERLANAPVFFSIVQARFNAILALDSYAPQIQEILRKQGFPDLRKSVLATFNLNMGSPSEASPPQVPVQQATRYTFCNMEQTAAFILDPGALSYQTTEYDIFSTFSAEFVKGLRAIHNAVDLSYTDRIGVRYLNAIFPKNGEKLSDYITNSLLGLVVRLDGDVIHAFSETLIRIGDAKVLGRAIIQNGEIGFPPDLQPLMLVLASRFRHLRGHHAILDMDSWFETREKFSLDTVQSRLSVVHSEAEKAFKAAVEEKALHAWE